MCVILQKHNSSNNISNAKLTYVVNYQIYLYCSCAYAFLKTIMIGSNLTQNITLQNARSCPMYWRVLFVAFAFVVHWQANGLSYETHLVYERVEKNPNK